MLDEFQSRYPTGSLISELLQIHQGKFVVRVSAQVEGVTRATGMAAAETLELAEDQARSRALMVLGIEPSALAQTGLKVSLPSAGVDVNQTNTLGTPSRWDEPVYSSFPAVCPREETLAPAESQGAKGNNNGLLATPTQIAAASATTFEITPKFQGKDSGELKTSIGDEWLVEESYNHSYEENRPVPEQTQPGTLVEAKQSIDATEAIARTSAELKRLGWSNQQGRDYLKKTYGKTARRQLTDDEMLKFLEYLESQPTPNQLPLL